MTPREAINELMKRICEKHGVSINVVLGKSRDALAVDARREICTLLREMGFSSTKIGLIVNRDHTSVLALTGSLKRKRKAKEMTQEELDRAFEQGREHERKLVVDRLKYNAEEFTSLAETQPRWALVAEIMEEEAEVIASGNY